MGFYSWKPYVSVAERRAKAEKTVDQANKKGARLSPVPASRGAIARTFWGKAWCDNLERYSDFANRLPRGRTYVRNGSVIDLKMAQGTVQAQVMGSSLYRVTVDVARVPAKQWQSIGADCAGSIDSMVELLQGKLSKGVMERICRSGTGLFPTPEEISFACSCPDWAAMCKHVAAVLYGVGSRLDQQPDLIFALRGVDPADLVKQAGAGRPPSNRRTGAGKVLDEASLADVFGIELAEFSPPKRSGAAGPAGGASKKTARAKRVGPPPAPVDGASKGKTTAKAGTTTKAGTAAKAGTATGRTIAKPRPKLPASTRVPATTVEKTDSRSKSKKAIEPKKAASIRTQRQKA
jgi:uncharacterized Zn finger protein